jgi:FKBP-type peptidyl-prolyl cis-trans isomerase SlyD
MKIEGKKKVTLHYNVTGENGEKYDSSEGKAPIQILSNSKNIILGFEENIAGMSEGEEKKFTVTPEKGYGERKEELVKSFEKSSLPNSEQIKKGMVVQFQSPDGRPYYAYVQDITEKEITFDLNHPLAGKKLNFEVKVEKVEEPSEEELKNGFIKPEGKAGCDCNDSGCDSKDCDCEGNCSDCK